MTEADELILRGIEVILSLHIEQTRKDYEHEPLPRMEALARVVAEEIGSFLVRQEDLPRDDGDPAELLDEGEVPIDNEEPRD